MINKSRRPHLVLGTVQLGLTYGAANQAGMPDQTAAIDLLRAALRAGITTLDTARAYGDSERRIGLALADPTLPPIMVVTKLNSLADLSGGASESEAVAAARASLAASRQALDRDRLDTVLLHRATHRSLWGGAIWRMLALEQQSGRIGTIGLSVQNPNEALAALKDPTVGHIQMPFNLLDHRWRDVIKMLRGRHEVTMHVRSVFLQGLLTGSEARWPSVPGIDPNDIMEILRQLAHALGRSGAADLCVAYVRGQDWIDGIVIGMETTAQLETNLGLFSGPALGTSECKMIETTLPRLPEALLDPAQWPKGIRAETPTTHC